MKDFFQIDGYFTGINPKADKTCTLRFNTQEVDPEKVKEIWGYLQSYGRLLFGKNEYIADEVPTDDAPVDGWKTPSQRLRGVLYVLWSEKKEGEFNSFYVKKMEEIIEHFKGKLDK